MTENPPPMESPRQEGRRLACEGILRSQFGQRPSRAVDQVMAQLKQESSADLQSAVSPIFNRQGVGPTERTRTTERPQNAILRYSRLQICATPFRRHPIQTSLALAAGIVFLLSLGFWYFGPTMGEPVLAEMKGADVSVERGTELISALSGMRLYPADVLRTGTNATVAITFGKEPTRVDLASGTETKLVSLASGKHLDLRAGRLEATVARQRPFRAMVLLTAQAEARVLGTKFTLTATTNATRLEVIEGKVKLTRKSDDTAVKVSGGYYAVAATNTELAALPATGRILREVWTNYPGAFIALMTSDESFSEHANDWEYLTRFETPPNAATRSGERVRGYVHPPVTGEYRFSIANTGSGEAFLFLSPDDKPENRVHITEADTTPLGTAPSPPPTPIMLVAGRKYYIEALHESDTGKGHCTVRWQRPGREREVIAGEFLSPVKSPTKEKKR